MLRLGKRRRLALDMSSKSNGKKKVPGVIIRGQPEQRTSIARTDTARGGAGDWGSAGSWLTSDSTPANLWSSKS